MQEQDPRGIGGITDSLKRNKKKKKGKKKQMHKLENESEPNEPAVCSKVTEVTVPGIS